MQRVLWLFLLFFIIAGCQAAPEQDNGTPTASPVGNPVPLTVDREALPVTIADLAADPDTYQNRLIRITGQYKPLPALVCTGQPYPLPAAWGLVGDGYLAYVQGFRQVRSLLPAGLSMTIVGQWQRWEGPVGCGKEAVYQEIWYLKATEIETPSSLARVTLTPADGAAALLAQVATPFVAGETTSTTTPAVGGVVTPTLETSTPVAEPAETTTAVAPTPTQEITLLPTLTPTRPEPSPTTNGITVTTTATPTRTEDNLTPTTAPPNGTPANEQETPVPGATITATVTGTPATPTPGPSPTATSTPNPQQSATPTTDPAATTQATSTPGPSQVAMGKISDEFLAIEQLESGTIHVWELTIAANDIVTAYVVAPVADLGLILRDVDRDVLATADSAGTGMVEALVYDISTAGTYYLHVSSADDTADYALMILYNDSYSFIFRGALTYGTPQNDALDAEQDFFWQFLGNAGDDITITVSPDANSDPFIRFYGPDAELISGFDFVDDGAVGDPETITYVLPDSGLYSVHLGEYDFNPMNYTITVTQN